MSKQIIHLGDLLLIVDNQKRNTQQYGAESLDSLLELALRRQLVGDLEPLYQITQLQPNCRHTTLSSRFFPTRLQHTASTEMITNTMITISTDRLLCEAL